MILSNVEIQRAMDEGRLVLTPEPSPRRPSPGQPDCPFQTSAVDLRLSDEITEFIAGKDKLGVSINLRDGGFTTLARTLYKSRLLEDGQPYSLEPGKLILTKTLERIHLPLSDKPPTLAARVEGRSSFARCGLLVHFTAPTIHAGFNGTIALEMMNLGNYPILLYNGMKICQLIVEEVSGIPFVNYSQFQGQTTAPGL